MDGNQIVRKSVVDTDHLKSNVTDVDVEKVKTPIKKDEKVGRNDPCPCGSGKKYKNCCGR